MRERVGDISGGENGMYKWKDRKRKGEKTANFWCTIECFQVWMDYYHFDNKLGEIMGCF